MQTQNEYAQFTGDMAQKIYGAIALVDATSNMISHFEEYKSIDALMRNLQYLTDHVRQSLLVTVDDLNKYSDTIGQTNYSNKELS